MTDADFTHERYAQILRAGLEADYLFLDYPAAIQTRAENTPVCVLRHDCDNDLVAARDMAKIEANLGVHATYFLMLRSVQYNLLAPPNLRLAREIVSLGHPIGLHFDEGRLSHEPPHAVAEAADAERQLLALELNVAVDVVSLHQPGARVMENRIKLNCINAYDRDDMAGFHYVSDTNMSWREAPPDELFRTRAHNRVQLLVHPEWWTADAMPIRAKWNRMFENNFRLAQDHMLSRERAYVWRQRIEFADEGRAESDR